MAQAFPKFIALHYSSGAFVYRHMRMVSENTSWRGHLAFDRREVVAPATKFELEPADAGNGKFRHIRCCYSNKYLALKAPDSRWITASAEKKDEDQSKFSSTLFEPIRGSAGGRIQLRHVATGRLAAIFSSPGLLITPCLYLSDHAAGDDDLSRFTVRDWESILILPQHLVFKADNGRCLSGRVMTVGQNRIGMLRFTGEDDIGDSTVSHTTRFTRDGRVMFISRFTGGFWDKPSSQNNEIYANGVVGAEFTPVKLGNDSNKVALKYGRFCRRNDAVFVADSTTTTKETQLEIKEAIFSRSIYNIRYRLMDARIYNENIQTLAPPSNFNNGTSQPQSRTQPISYSQTESSTWDHSVAFNLGVETTFKTGIPFIAQGEIATSLNVGYGYDWGKTKTETKNLSVKHTVVVPPQSRITVTLLATKGMCDVPFSYTQRDTLTDGRQVITFHDDGLYTGVTYYNFKYQTTRADL